MSKYDFKFNPTPGSIDELIISRIKKGTTILEFGPAHGRLSQYLSEVLACNIYGVDIDENAAKDASKFFEKLIIGNIEDYEWLDAFSNLRFDYIIFADVLEHLYNPEEVLKKCALLLKGDGSVIVSIPNITHNAIIISLIQNEFSYKETGILDNTHIRFFSDDSATDLFAKAGYLPVYRDASYLEPNYTEFNKSYADIDLNLLNVLYDRKYGEVYQFFFELKLKSLIEQSNEIPKGLRLRQNIELYYDTGNGFTPEQKFLISSNGKGEIQFNQTDSISRIRLDPVRKMSKIKVNKFQIIDKYQNIYQAEIASHNAEVSVSNTFIFYSDDPQIIFDLNGIVIDKFIFDFEVLNIVDSSINSVNKLLQENHNLKLEIQNLTQQLVVKDAILQRIYNSYFWRVFNRLRLFKKKY